MELSQNERCEYMHVHEDIVAKVEKEMPDDEILFDLAELFNIRGLHAHQNFVFVV